MAVGLTIGAGGNDTFDCVVLTAGAALGATGEGTGDGSTGAGVLTGSSAGSSAFFGVSGGAAADGIDGCGG